MEIVVVPAEAGVARYWLRSLWANAIFNARANRGAPAVLAVGADRTAVLLQRSGTDRQAERVAARYRWELHQLGPDAFCARYRLPAQLLGGGQYGGA